MARITWQLEKRGEWEVIHYHGTLNEDAAVVLEQFLTRLGPRCVFNLRGVDYVNSNGVRAFLLFLREFTARREVCYEACSPVVVTQLNLIPGLLESIRVLSVMAPFGCQSCQTQTDVVVAGPSFPTKSADLPRVTCPKCGSACAFLERVEEYFDFAATAAKSPPSSR